MFPKLAKLALTAALLVAACGDASAGSTASSEAPAPGTTAATTTSTATGGAGFPLTVSTPAGEITLERMPERIVSLSPTATEMLFAIGAGDLVVAVDEFSNYPAEAPVTDLSGYQPNLEALATYEPDLVVIQFDPGDLVDGLDALGVPTLVAPAAAGIADTYTQIAMLGAVTGHSSEAAAVVEGIKSDIDRILSGLPGGAARLTYYHELDPTFYTVTSATFIGEMYTMLGLVNVADGDDPAGNPYPQLSAEYLVEQDPDLIFLADTKCCGESAATVAARPGWSELTAVKAGRVLEVDDDIASRWGPRIVEYLELVAQAMAAAAG